MMKIIRHLFSSPLLLMVTSAFAQTTIKVISQKDGALLPYATVVNHTSREFQITDENGNVSLKCAPGDSLTISYVGYKTRGVRYQQGGYLQALAPLEIRRLPDVSISSCKKTEEAIYTNDIDSNAALGGVRFSKGPVGLGAAVRLHPQRSNTQLKEFSFWIKTAAWIPKSAIKDPMMFTIYSVNDSTHLPDEQLLTAPIVYHPKNFGKQTLLLDSLHLSIPENGIYICFQYIMTEGYGWDQHLTSYNGSGDTIVHNYGGVIDGKKATGFELVFYDVFNDKWSFPGKLNKESYDDPHGTIRFSAVLKYCKDK